jgi:endonuclease-3 related protein
MGIGKADPSAFFSRMYELLYGRYGPQRWWPGEDRFEIIVGAILTQNTSWTNAEKALINLKTGGALTPKRIRELPQNDLAILIKPSGYFNSKARKLKSFAQFLDEFYCDSLDCLFSQEPYSLRWSLLSVYGIGEETADDILLYAAGLPRFVIDSYTIRILSRLEVISGGSKYDSAQTLFESNLKSDVNLFNEYHALLDRHGKEVCRKVPLCRECCLLEICPTGITNTRGWGRG